MKFVVFEWRYQSQDKSFKSFKTCNTFFAFICSKSRTKNGHTITRMSLKSCSTLYKKWGGVKNIRGFFWTINFAKTIFTLHKYMKKIGHYLVTIRALIYMQIYTG